MCLLRFYALTRDKTCLARTPKTVQLTRTIGKRPPLDNKFFSRGFSFYNILLLLELRRNRDFAPLVQPLRQAMTNAEQCLTPDRNPALTLLPALFNVRGDEHLLAAC